MTQQHGATRRDFWTFCPEAAGLGSNPNKRFMGMYIHMNCLPLRGKPEIEQFFTITYTRNSLQLKQNLKGVLIMNLFEKFEVGKLALPSGLIDFESVAWSPHAKFEGVALKHLITSKDTNGAFSYHLVRIAPNKKIGNHIHETQLETHEIIAGNGVCVNDGKELSYEEGVISIFSAGIEHEVIAGANGLYLFAKFMPALC